MSKATFECNELINLAYCDIDGNARLSNVLALAQQMSERHCASVNMGYDFFVEKGKVFLLAKLNMDIKRMPKGNEVVTLKTHAFLPRHACFNRYTDFFDSKGNLLVSIDSRWILVDIDTHKICRRLPEDIPLPFDDMTDKTDFHCIGNVEPTLLHSIKVMPHMLDVNRHVNNTVYGEFIFDVAEEVLPKGYTIKGTEIYYHNEIKPNSTIDMKYQDFKDSLYVLGEVDGTKCFEAVLRY